MSGEGDDSRSRRQEAEAMMAPLLDAPTGSVSIRQRLIEFADAEGLACSEALAPLPCAIPCAAPYAPCAVLLPFAIRVRDSTDVDAPEAN